MRTSSTCVGPPFTARQRSEGADGATHIAMLEEKIIIIIIIIILIIIIIIIIIIIE